MTASITDVRNKSDLTDYTGELVAELDLRITDRFNGATHTDTGTMQNITFRLKLTCIATPGVPDIGATCGANTTRRRDHSQLRQRGRALGLGARPGPGDRWRPGWRRRHHAERGVCTPGHPGSLISSKFA